MFGKISAKKLLVGGGIFLFAVVVLIYALYTIHGEEDVLKVLSDKVDFQIRDFHYTEVGDPDVTWEINADTATYIREDNVTLFENVLVRLIFSSGDTFVITGENGSLHTDTKDVDIRGNVVASTDQGDRFETASLHYSHNDGDGMIHTEDAVIIVRPGITVRGVGMNLSLKTRKATLLSDVKATIDREKT